jgi:hypothetical protein
MELNPDDRKYVTMAIQTVLHNNRHRIHLFMEEHRQYDFIREMSDEIWLRAKRFKDMENTPGD